MSILLCQIVPPHRALCMIAADLGAACKLLESESLRRIFCKCLAQNSDSQCSPQLSGAGDVAPGVTTSLKTASLFRKDFLLAAPLQQSWSANKVSAAGGSSLPAPRPPPSLQRGATVSGYFPLLWGAAIKRTSTLCLFQKLQRRSAWVFQLGCPFHAVGYHQKWRSVTLQKN